jgi:cellulose synthase/poly-beta-1,6-N-acetylglucosamine synthase-like glycosyltransferase
MDSGPAPGSQNKIIALLPAHNEAESIAATLRALQAQTRVPDLVIVICDNCTDATAEIAREHGTTVWVTSGNTHKKAGALNYALRRVLPELDDDDAVLVQDADSFLDPDFVAVTAAKLDEGYAAAGGNFHAREGGGLCGTFQRNEYARYARDNARKRGRVLCITGVGTLFRVSALRAVAEAIADDRLPDSGGGLVYSYATLTEDNWMTLALKHLGFRFVSPKDATMSTEAMLTWGALAGQRLRWKRGAFEDLLSFGLTRHTLKGWGLQLVSTIGVIATLVYVGSMALSPWLGFHPKLWFLAISAVYCVERVVTVASRGWKVQLFSAAVFPEWFYDLFLQSVQIRALWGVVWRTSKSW